MEEHDHVEQDDKGILDTVRRILSEDQARSPDQPHRDGRSLAEHAANTDDVFELEPAMMVDNAPASPPPAPAAVSTPEPGDRHLINERTEETARRSLGSLRNAMREQRAVLTHRGGPSIEDIIRDEMRPLLREWLDMNLPPLVEKLVRSEISRIAERDGA